MHLGASSSNLRRRGQGSSISFCRFYKIKKNSCYYDIHIPIISLRFKLKSMYKYALVTIGHLICIYFVQIIHFLFFRHA